MKVEEYLEQEQKRKFLEALTQQAYELCLDIEKLPASIQQTSLNIAASSLYNQLRLYKYENTSH